MQKVVVICGPTATGKSDLAVLIAKKFNGEIISADSRQVYRGLDLCSGKITKKEMRSVPHFMLDIADPKKVYTADKFGKDALRLTKEIIKRKKLPIICGGTGMYIDALIDGIKFPQVKPDKKLRKELSTYSTENLYQKLISLDQNRAEQLKNDGGGEFNRVRLVRSIEIATKIGAVPPLKGKANFEAVFIGLDFDDETLRERISLRIRSRMKKGMLSEARKLHQNGLSFKRMYELGLELRCLADLLQNKITKEKFQEKLETDTWQFAKRQRTWLKRRKEILWFKMDSKEKAGKKGRQEKEIAEVVENFINGKDKSTIN